MAFDILFWHWWIAAVVLLSVEMLSAGFFFLWMAVSALITGLVLLVMPSMSLELQLFIFSVLSMLSVLIWKRYLVQHPVKTDHPYLNQRGAEYIGQSFTVVEAIKNGRGKVKVADSRWTAQGEDCPIGSSVKVIAVDGTLFKVEITEIPTK